MDDREMRTRRRARPRRPVLQGRALEMRRNRKPGSRPEQPARCDEDRALA